MTRLHTRYDRATLSEDLVFRAAEPMLGGRDGSGVDAQRAWSNNFQARYIIHHHWAGPMACANPAYEQWGGPPPEAHSDGAVVAARHLASAPRGKLPLPSAVYTAVPTLRLPGHPHARPRAQSDHQNQ